MLLHKKRVSQACLLFLLPSLMLYHIYTFPTAGAYVEGIFYIDTCKRSEKYGGGWNYRGTLKTENGRLKCRCFSKEFYSAHRMYQISGTVRPLKGSLYALKTQSPWEISAKRVSLTTLRKSIKESVKRYIEKHYEERAAHFLTGMVTGETEDLILLNAFNQLGVSHLMAISGLHFSLLALAFHLLLRLFLPYKIEASILLALMSGYLLFIGETPSVLRAWISVTLFLLGQIFERRCCAINALGCALLLSLLWNPLSATSLSLQLSFLATAGILFFYTPCQRMLMWLLPKRPLKEVVEKHALWQHLYIFVSFFREALALTIAVHVALLPLLLSTFHFFSCNSLFYNLFFPFLASAALLFFLASLPFGSWGHFLNSYYCNWILKIPESPPLFFKSLYVPQIPSWILTLWLTLILLIALLSHSKKEDSLEKFPI